MSIDRKLCRCEGSALACQFEARYDDSPVEFTANHLAATFFNDEKCPRKKTYVRDICIHCGQTVERKA